MNQLVININHTVIAKIIAEWHQLVMAMKPIPVRRKSEKAKNGEK